MAAIYTTIMLHLLMLTNQLVAAPPPEADQGLVCYDWKGTPVMAGFKYIPKKDDPCMACVCDDGFPIMCTAVLCSPPECHMWEQVEGECCKFHCIEPDHPTRNRSDLLPPNTIPNGDVDKANLGLRLIASTVTSFLILALLVFMVHRLRQRRMLIMMRRIHREQRDEDAVAYMSNFDQVDVGIEFPPYEEPPPPYTPPKPPDIPQGEAPPPYTPTPDTGTSNYHMTNNNGGHLYQGEIPVNNNPSGRILESPVNNPGHDAIEAITTINHQQNEIDVSSSMSISRSNREVIAEAERLSPQLQSRTAEYQIVQRQNPPEPQYDDIRNNLLRSLSAEVGSTSETESVLSSPEINAESQLYMSHMPHSSSSSSQVLVRMHNDSPQSQLVRTSTDVMTTSAPPCLSLDNNQRLHNYSLRHSQSYAEDNQRPFLPTYRPHFLKRSDSVEIKLASNSPRNSFYLDDQCSGINVNPSMVNGATSSRMSPLSSPESESGVRKCKRQPIPNVTWNKSSRPFRIGQTNAVDNNSNREASSRPNIQSEVSDVKNRHKDGSFSLMSPSPPSTISHRENSQSMDLDIHNPVDLLFGASCPRFNSTKYSNDSGSSSISKDPSPTDGVLEVGVSPTGSGLVSTTGSSDMSPVYDGPSTSSGVAPHLSPTTPQSPTMIRSGSLTSQASQVSVCSETGETKSPKPHISYPRSLMNDSCYPLSPLTSNFAAPIGSIPPVTRSSWRKAGGSDNSSRAPVPTSSPCEALVSAEEIGMDFQAAANNQGPAVSSSREARPGVRLNKISYVDVSPERDSSDQNAMSCSTDSSSAYPKQPTSPMTNDSTLSSLSPLTPDDDACEFNHPLPACNSNNEARDHASNQEAASNWPDKQTVRKVKKQIQKKRQSRGEIDTFNDERNIGERPSRSPERHKRIPRSIESGTTFKEYGFIDDPDVINNARDHSGNAVVNGSSLPRNLNVRKQNSQDQSDNSQDRRNHSGERKRGHSRERRRSRERTNSSERKGGNTVKAHDFSERSRDPHKRNSIKRTRSRSAENQPNGTVHLDNNKVRGQNGTINDNDCKKRDRDKALYGASMERRKKRRSTGDVGLKFSNASHSQTVANCLNILANDCSLQSSRSGLAWQHAAEAGTAKLRSKRPKSNHTRENRHSLPLNVSKNR